MRITVNATDTINSLMQYRKSIPYKVKRFLNYLSELGIQTAKLKFDTAQYDGVNDVVVEPVKWVSDTKLQIVASGTTILFIEFGTGITYTEQHPQAGEFGFVRGGYGKGMGKRRGWAYKGETGTNGALLDNGLVLTHGNPPARAMYGASKIMKAKIREIAKEVFK